MYKLDTAAVRLLVAEAIEEKGADHVSPLYFDENNDGPLRPSIYEDVNRASGDSACRYVAPNGEAGCIVGQVLIKAGVPRELLSSMEGKSAPRVLGAWDVNQAVEITDDAKKLLADMQCLQDNGIPWGWMAENIDRRPYYELLSEWNEQLIESE